MKKFLLLSVYILFICLSSYAQSSDARWERWQKTMVQDQTFVEGFGVLEYILFRVDEKQMETNIMKEASFHIAFMKSLEELDFIVDYNSLRISDNPRLSTNVIRMMNKHNANISITLHEPDENGAILVIINIDTSYFHGPGSALAPYDIVTFNVYQKTRR